MHIIIESHIPFIQGKVESVGHTAEYFAPEDITPQAVKEADALIVRTRTRCNADLLDGSRVKKIATATIGTDHIDLDYCRSHGIEVHNAPGCNAPAVAQYVLASIAELCAPGVNIGIVGVGHVGSIVERWAIANGFGVLRCDPPRAAAEGSEGFVTLDEIARRADVVTFHTPLDSTTRHMADAAFFSSLARRPVVINAARGAIVNTTALIQALGSGKVANAVIDCWEGEPNISAELLKLAKIATPHIAGYSAEGKMRATAMALHAIDSRISMALPPVADAPTLAAISASYSPLADTAALRSAPEQFEQLRNQYSYRAEPR
jgi:erythronate-4-phosphate dehydrogenase